MRTTVEQNKLIIYLEGRIDSTNAGEMQKWMEEALAANPGKNPIIDAEGLPYISSAGLRVLMKLRKGLNQPLELVNVSRDVYDILETTGFTELLRVKKAYRSLSVDGCEVIGHGAVGTVYRIDEDTIVKVYELPDSLPMIENEQKRAKQAFLKGIPTAISYDVVKVGEKYGSVFELLRASTYNDVIVEQSERKDEIVREYAHFMRQLHAVEMERGKLPEAKAVFVEYLDRLRPILPKDLYDRLSALLAAMPENLHMVHGDIQMKNIMLSGNEPLLIDMDTLSVGDPVFDLMGLYVTYVLFNEDDPTDTQTFLGMSKELSTFIWEKTIQYYFDDCDGKTLEEAETKIRIVGCLRFLFLVAVLGIGKPEVRQIRMGHTLARLRELVPQVDSLEIERKS